MAYFFSLPSSAKRMLVNYFLDKPKGTKIKYGCMLQGKGTALNSIDSYVLKNSYIN